MVSSVPGEAAIGQGLDPSLRNLDGRKGLGMGAGPVSKWLSSHAQLQRPGIRGFESRAQTRHRSSSHAEVASHVPQLKGPTTKDTQLCTGELWEKKGKIKSFKKRKKKRKGLGRLWVQTALTLPSLELHASEMSILC